MRFQLRKFFNMRKNYAVDFQVFQQIQFKAKWWNPKILCTFICTFFASPILDTKVLKISHKSVLACKNDLLVKTHN